MSMELHTLFELENRSGHFVGPGHLSDHFNELAPYLVVICVVMVTGTIGNVFVIGAVLVNKVTDTYGNFHIPINECEFHYFLITCYKILLLDISG